MAAMSTCWHRVTMRSKSQRLSLDRGGASMISTVSPSCDSLFSSCTWHTVRRRMNLPYFGCRTRRSISTRRVLCILSPVTTPVTCLLGMVRVRGSGFVGCVELHETHQVFGAYGVSRRARHTLQLAHDLYGGGVLFGTLRLY